MKKNFLVAFISILIISTMSYATSYVIHDYDTGIMHMAQDIYLTNTNSVQTQIDSIETNLNGSYALKSGTLSQFTGGTNLNQIATRNHNDLQNTDASSAHPASSITNVPVGDIAAVTVQAALNELDSEKVSKAGSLTQITTRNHNDLQNLNAGSAHPSASIDNTSTSYGKGLATTDNTVQKIADRVNQNGTPQFITDKTKCSLLLDFKGTLADKTRAINPIGSDAANKWVDNYVNDSTTKTSATNVSVTLKQFDGDEGKFGSGVAVEESRTNLLTYSDDLTNAAWVKDNCTVTLDRVENGQKIFKVTITASAGSIYQSISFSNIPYTASAFIKKNGAFSINICSDDLVFFYPTTTTNFTKMTRIYGTATRTAGTKNLYFGFQNATAGDTFYITSPQLEAGASPTSYIATGATAVTRPAGKLSYDPKLINNNQGSISFWYKANYNYDDAGTIKVLLNNWVDANNGFNLQYNTSEDKFSLDYIKNGSLYQIKSSAQTSDFNNHIFHIVVKWTSTDYYLYIDNVLIGSVGNLDIGITTLFSLGYYTDGARYCCNGTISNFEIFNYALSADEISQIYNSGLEGKPIITTNPQKIIEVGQTLYDTLFTTFASGWAISSTYPNKPTLSKSSNVALMRGILEYSGVVNSDVTLFTLPVGARPSLPDTYYHSFVTTARDSGSPAMRILRVYGNGDVVLMAQGATITNPALSLDNINFVNGK